MEVTQMTHATLSKEYIETLLARSYVGATNFTWNGHTVELDYVKHITTDDFTKMRLAIQTRNEEIRHLQSVVQGLYSVLIGAIHADKGQYPGGRSRKTLE